MFFDEPLHFAIRLLTGENPLPQCLLNISPGALSPLQISITNRQGNEGLVRDQSNSATRSTKSRPALGCKTPTSAVNLKKEMGEMPLQFIWIY